MSSRYETVYAAEAARLAASLERAGQRILERRQKEGDSQNLSLYHDGSCRQDLDHHGGFGGFDRRMWQLVHQDGRNIYLFEHARRTSPKGVELEDVGTFGLAVSYPTLKSYYKAEIRDGAIRTRQSSRPSYEYHLQSDDLGRLVVYPDKARYQHEGTYIGSMTLDDLHASDLTIDQIILTTEALDHLYTDQYFYEDLREYFSQ